MRRLWCLMIGDISNDEVTKAVKAVAGADDIGDAVRRVNKAMK